MIKSMTGFGRYESVNEERKIVVEIKSVNHRYCDISIRMQKRLNYFEAKIRNLLKKYANRGNIDMYITYEDYTKARSCVKYNQTIAKEYADALAKMSSDLGIENDVNASVMSRYPEVFILEEESIDEEKIWKVLEEAICKACEKFVETRVAEGENLKKDIIEKLDYIDGIVDFIVERSPQIVEEYRKKLTQKVEELLGDTKIDEAYLATEITVFADKICVDEETVRLRSHISSMKNTLNSDESIGRKLDFIAQEMNREANTILSKANDIEVSNKAIDLKTEIEKIREQIQNIE